MKKTITFVILLGFVSLSTACGGNSAPNLNTNNDIEDVENIDADSDVGGEQDVEPGQDADPEKDVEEQPANDCKITTETCGACDLGLVIHCTNEEDVLHNHCEIPHGLQDIECNQLIFVDGEKGNDIAAGTKDSPIKSLANGLTKAKTDNLLAVIVAGTGNSAKQTGPISIANGVSIIGGYDSDFIYTPDNRVSIQVPADPGHDTVGLLADGIDKPTVVSRLEITTADVTTGSFSNMAVHIKNSNNLSLSHINATAGNGGAGANGNNGNAGNLAGADADGKDGRNEEHATSTNSGPGGKNTCARSNVDPAGGKGGVGRQASTNVPGAGSDAFAGTAGGKAGDNDNRGMDGRNGSTPKTGKAGSGGSSIMDTAQLWVIGKGDGQSGLDGENGPGGGGGGGAWAPYTSAPNAAALSGGGGGAGGCGGAHGTGGKEGGASFGLFLVDSTVTIQDSKFTAGKGGKGGTGGDGGLGQAGGVGGNGYLKQSEANAKISAGSGGDGAAGASGGPGGGGAGGVSFGAYCYKTTITGEGIQYSFNATENGGTPGKTTPSTEAPESDLEMWVQGIPGEHGKSGESFGCD